MSAIVSMLLVASFAPTAEAATGDDGKTITRSSSTANADDGKTIKRSGGRQTAPSRPAAGNNRNKAKKKSPWIGPFEKGAYPRAEIQRPLVLPGSMVEAELNGGAVGAADTVGGAVNLRGAVGIGDVLELGVGTGIAIADSVGWNETIGLSAHVLAKDGQRFDWAPGLTVPINLAQGAGFGLDVDLTSRYVTGKKVWMYFGKGAIPIAITPDVGIALAANGGLGFQVSEGTAVLIDTNLARLDILPDVNVTGVWDTFVGNAAVQFSPARRTDLGLRATVANSWTESDALTWGANAYGVVRF